MERKEGERWEIALKTVEKVTWKSSTIEATYVY